MLDRILHEIRDLGRMSAGHVARLRNQPSSLRNLTLSLTYRCNARCTMCNIWENPTDPSEEITLDVIRDVADSPFLRGLVSLSLTGGEPLLYEDLPEVAGIFSKRIPGCYISTVTNGLAPALTFKKVEQILQHTTNEIWVNVSIDSLDETYNEVRGVPGGEKKVIQTTEGLVEMAKGEPRLNIGILYTLMPENFGQALPVLNYANNLGVQFTLNVINGGDVYYQQTPEPTFVWYRDHIEEILDLFADLAAAGYDRPLARKLLSFFPPYLEKVPRRPIACFSGFTSAFISPLGGVYPCVPSGERYKMGNLFEQSFDEIWTSHRAKRVREAVNRVECNCLLTCETTNSLKFSPAYLLERLSDKTLGKRGEPGKIDPA